MGSKPDIQLFDILWQILCEHEGLKPGMLLPLAGIGLSRNIYPTLATMEYNGYLLSEDDEGRLFPFCRISREERKKLFKELGRKNGKYIRARDRGSR